MHSDGRLLENETLIEGDICIVGAGAAGISMALEWSKSPHKVILLEGGGFEYDPKIQDLYAGKTTGQAYFPLMSSRLHYFGGTTGHWAGFCSTLDPIDFAKRKWVEHSGWPIMKTDLDPYYERAQKKIELGPYEYDMAFWQKKDPSLEPLFKRDSVVWNKMWQFSPPTRFGVKYRTDIIKSKNIHLYTYANVVNILTNENGSSIREVIIKNFEGKQHRVRAKNFILACCSIQNARLLLASDLHAPRGLGNDNDLVGRFFMEHLEIKSAELWLLKPDPLKLYAFDFGVTKARAELAIRSQKQEEFSILNGTVSLRPLDLAKKLKPAIERWNQEDPRKSGERFFGNYGKASQEASLSNSASRSYELFTRIEQAPNPSSRVTLDSEKDGLGVPRASLHWELTSFEKRSLRKMYEMIGQEAGVAGIGRVKMMDYLLDKTDNSWPSFTGGGWHHMGTTRMSDDPKQGVVDANCKVHGITNLFIAGSSCFTTAGAANPTLTLIALTIRLSDHVKTLMRT
ncbi:MAG TPA: GMC family oxidoreductase, partial [Chitinophagaceae bacterium]|nr:GMC family oxidoreductase [Chitinophagaceae bacterium]